MTKESLAVSYALRQISLNLLIGTSSILSSKKFPSGLDNLRYLYQEVENVLIIHML